MPKHKQVALVIFAAMGLVVAVNLGMTLVLAAAHKPSYTYVAVLGGGLLSATTGLVVATLAWLGKLPACKPTA